MDHPRATPAKPRRFTRRELGLAAGALAGTAFGAACAAGGEQPAARPQQPVQLQLWTTPVTHLGYFKELAPAWRQKSGIEVEPTMITATSGGQSAADKYQVAIASGTGPDLADFNQGWFGRFLRGDVPLVEIGPLLRKEGYWDKLIATRQALYTWKGKNYGVEHALTPVVLYYRKDLFDRVGAKIESLKTWDDYVEVGKRMVNDDLQFHMYGFDAALRQRGSDYFNENGEMVADTPLGMETLEFLSELAQRHLVINRPLPQGMDFWTAVVANRYATYVNADWGAGFIKQYAPQTAGLWAAVALPTWRKDSKPRRTSAQGGTGHSIIKATKFQKEAWDTLKFYVSPHISGVKAGTLPARPGSTQGWADLLPHYSEETQFYMLDPSNAARRYEMINLFPPLKDAFKDPRLHVKEDFFGGQDLGKLFQDLAPDVPAQHQHPLRPEVNTIIGRGVTAAMGGQQAPRDALKTVGEEARNRLKQEGY